MGFARRKKQKRSNKANKKVEIVDDHEIILNKFSKLKICLEAEDDIPHPRHLCFRYPFHLTSHHLHCIKCYCYVCEEVAPCKKWSKLPNEHCHATNEDEIWRTERESRNKVPATNMTMDRHILTVSFMQYPPDKPELVNGFAGALICDNTGNWVAGFSMHIQNAIGSRDPSLLPLLTLIEGLELGWAKGFRCLEVRLGFQYHDGFWQDFKKDATNGKYCVIPSAISPPYEYRIWSIVEEAENCLNQDWFIDVKNTACFKEETGAIAMASLAQIKPGKQVYDFPSHPLTAEFKNLAKVVERNPEYCQGNPGYDDDLRSYVGLAP